MTKEQEELQKSHARFKELQEVRRAGKLTEEEERELIQLTADLEERSVNALVQKALQATQGTGSAEANQAFLEAGRRAYSTHQAVDVEARAATLSPQVEAARPTVIQEILQPLEAELIHTKVGLKIQTGVHGQPVWPVLAGVKATIAGENVPLSDQAINLDKLSAKSERVGVYVPITMQALETSENLRSITTERLAQAVGDTLNTALFAKTAPSSPNNGIGSVLAAPYAAPLTSGWSASVAPTIKEVTSLEAEVLGKEVKVDNSTAYFVHPKTYCMLKSTPIEKGNPKMMLEDGHMNNLPVIPTTYIPEDAILFGTLSYAVLAHHGKGDRFYAQYNGVYDRIDFTLNGDYSITVLRPEAFAAIKRK
nr:MAG TPA: major capsid protein [Caudoviricetes sp.]